MSAQLAPALSALPDIRSRIALALEGHKPATIRNYASGFAHFAAWRGVSVDLALSELLALGPRDGAILVEHYRNEFANLRTPKLPQGPSSAAIAGRVAPLRSFVRVQRLGWILDVRDPKKEKRRDMRGPTPAEFRLMLDATPGVRERALLRMLRDRGLRIREVLTLELEHVRADCRAVSVRRKGRRERKWVDLAGPTGRALAAWIAARGSEPGPLFGISYSQSWRIVNAAGKRVGLTVSCHRLRHTFARAMKKATGGDMYATAQGMDHASPTTTVNYLDAQDDEIRDAVESAAEPE